MLVQPDPAARSQNLSATMVRLLLDLQASRELEDYVAQETIEKRIASLLPSLIDPANEDMAELAVYCISALTLKNAMESFRLLTSLAGAVRQDIGDRVRRLVQLSGNDDLNELIGFDITPDDDDGPVTPIMNNLASITMIVHGTLATRTREQSEWWEPKGSFASAVAGAIPDLYRWDDYFSWSGVNSDRARRRAAYKLVDWAQRRLSTGGHLRLICHSHGGNVALLAAQEGLKIRKLMLLGTPIRTDYVVTTHNIDSLVNIYSPTDQAQTGGALWRTRGEGRTLADTEHIQNRVTADPHTSHEGLHDWSVWLNEQNRFDILF